MIIGFQGVDDCEIKMLKLNSSLILEIGEKVEDNTYENMHARK